MLYSQTSKTQSLARIVLRVFGETTKLVGEEFLLKVKIECNPCYVRVDRREKRSVPLSLFLVPLVVKVII